METALCLSVGILGARHDSCGLQGPNQSVYKAASLRKKIKLKKDCYQQNAKSLFFSFSFWLETDISLISEIKEELLTVRVNAEFYYCHISK